MMIRSPAWMAINSLLLALLSACQSSTTPTPTASKLPMVDRAPTQAHPTSIPEPTSTTNPTQTVALSVIEPTAALEHATPLDAPIEWEKGIPVTSFSLDSNWTAQTIYSESRLLLQVIPRNGGTTWLVIDKNEYLSSDYPFPTEFRWSADGRYLYYYGSTGRYYYHPGPDEICDMGGINVDPRRLDLESGEIVPLTPYQPSELEKFSISPSARIFAYFDPDRTVNALTLRDLATGKEQRLMFYVPPGEPWTVTRIEWAPNESALAFTVVASPCNATGIYPISFIVVDLEEGIARTVISDDPILAWQFEWLGNDVLLVHGQGMQRRIDVNAGTVIVEERMPVLSPDEGQDLGWLTFIADPGGYPAVFAVRADGSGLEQLSEDISGLFADIDHPRIEDWSPDGAWIAFTGLPRNANDVDVFVARVDRLERTNLTDSRATDGDPDWSPDGEQIAYSSQLPGWNSQPDIYIMPAHPREPIQPSRLTETLTFDSAPAWSPDGFRIAFASTRMDQNGSDLYLIGADGSGLQRLTDDPAGEAGMVWSPDSRRIAFTSDRDGYSRIYVIDVADLEITQVTKTASNQTIVMNNSPIWSPDGNYIAYISTRGETPGIFIARADGGGEWAVIEAPVWANSLFWGIPAGLQEP